VSPIGAETGYSSRRTSTGEGEQSPGKELCSVSSRRVLGEQSPSKPQAAEKRGGEQVSAEHR